MNLFRKALSWLNGNGLSGRSVTTPDGPVLGRGDALARWAAGGSMSALQVSAFRACVQLYANMISSLPIEVHEGDEAGRSRAVGGHPVASLLNDAPNADQTSVDFLQALVCDLEIHQNAFVEIVRGTGERVVSLDVLAAATVAPQRLANGALRYVGSNLNRRVDLDEAAVIHVRGLGGAVLGAPSTLSHAQYALSLAREIDAAGLGFFRNGMRPSGVLQYPQPLNAQQRALAEQGLVEKFMGATNAGRPLLLDGGATFNTLSADMEDAQMVAMRGAVLEDICRFFGVPPFLIGHTEKQTSWGTGVEQQTLGFYKFGLSPRLRRIEKAMTRRLLPRGSGLFLRFQMDDLLRPDAKTRAEIAEIMTRSGALTPNEWRGWEGLPPIEGGDVARTQMQNVPLADARQEVGDANT